MTSSKDKKKKPHGQIRQSHVVMTFGPGSMFDLPNQAVIIGGLEYWTKGDEVHEPRLLAKLKDLLKLTSLVLHAPHRQTMIRDRHGRPVSTRYSSPSGSSLRAAKDRKRGARPGRVGWSTGPRSPGRASSSMRRRNLNPLCRSVS